MVLSGRNLCPCVLKFDDNSTEFAALVERNRQYQVSRERVLPLCRARGGLYQAELVDAKYLVFN